MCISPCLLRKIEPLPNSAAESLLLRAMVGVRWPPALLTRCSVCHGGDRVKQEVKWLTSMVNMWLIYC